MNTSFHKHTTMLFVAACLAFALPAQAKQGRGADDPAGHVSGGNGADDPAGHVSGGNGADDPAGHVSGGNGADDPANHDANDDHGGGSSGKPRISARVVDDASDASVARGKFRQTVKKNRTRLRLDVKLKDSTNLPDADAADAATVTALFDDGTGATVPCELDFDDFARGKAEYQLRLDDRNGSLSEKAGDCGGELPPVVSGQTVLIRLQLPSDDPAATPRTVGTVTIP